MFVDTAIRGFQSLCNITQMNKYFVMILHSRTAICTKKIEGQRKHNLLFHTVKHHEKVMQ